MNNFMQERISKDINKMVLFESVESAVNNMNQLVDVYNKFFGQEVIRWNLKNADPTNFDMDVFVGGNVYSYNIKKNTQGN